MSRNGPKTPVITKLLKLATAAFERVTTGDCNRVNSFSAHDCLLNGLAVFFYKCSSLLEFDRLSHQDEIWMANLRRLFGIKRVPSDTTLRRRLDKVEPKCVHRVLRTSYGWARRHRLLEPFRVQRFGDRVPVLIDGTGFVTSTKVKCDSCLERKTRKGEIRYSHAMLGAVVVHPDVRLVLPMAAEPIVKVDVAQKQDCEHNAFQRLLPRLNAERQSLRMIVIADALYAKETAVSKLAAGGHGFILTPS